MEIFISLFLCWCITNIIVNGDILDPIRNWTLVKIPIIGKLLSCIMCSGLWIGILIYPLMVLFTDIENVLFNNLIIDWISFSFISSGYSVVINSLMIYFLKKINNDEG